MANTQRARAKSITPPTAQDLRMLGALKKASAEPKQKAAVDGVPFIGGKKKLWFVPEVTPHSIKRATRQGGLPR